MSNANLLMAYIRAIEDHVVTFVSKLYIFIIYLLLSAIFTANRKLVGGRLLVESRYCF